MMSDEYTLTVDVATGIHWEETYIPMQQLYCRNLWPMLGTRTRIR